MKISMLQRMIALNRKQIRALEQSVALYKESLTKQVEYVNLYKENLMVAVARSGSDPDAYDEKYVEALQTTAKREMAYHAQLVSKVRKHKQKLAKFVEVQKALIAELKAQYRTRSTDQERLQTIVEFNELWDQRSAWGKWFSSETITRFFK